MYFQLTVYSLQFTVYSLQFTVYSLSIRIIKKANKDCICTILILTRRKLNSEINYTPVAPTLDLSVISFKFFNPLGHPSVNIFSHSGLVFTSTFTSVFPFLSVKVQASVVPIQPLACSLFLSSVPSGLITAVCFAR